MASEVVSSRARGQVPPAMKVPEPLPEAVVPYAERVFAWFPEVLVSLGTPNLQELYQLPPMPGAQMRLEETGEHKFIQIRLLRRTSEGSGGWSGKAGRRRTAGARRSGT